MKSLYFLGLCALVCLGCTKENHSYADSSLKEIVYDFSKAYINAKRQEFLLNDIRVSDKFILRDQDGQLINFDDLIKDGPILVFRYSNMNCSPCVENTLSELNGFKLKENVIILGTYSNIRSFSTFVRINNNRCSSYFLDASENNLENSCFDPKLNPYLFILDVGKKIKYPLVLLENVEGEIKLYNDLLSKTTKK